ncbi:MAG: PIN domain-containing protein [Verrucomicrobiota bacterium]|nr:PIN domain-containing protein [Verrucomicrobiota bacterium]
MIKTFLDTGIFLAAWRGNEQAAGEAVSIMEDANREFFTAQLVKLELLPKPVFHKNHHEISFYNTHFLQIKKEEPLSESLGNDAMRLAKQYGISAADSLNIAAAIRLGVQEFITTEARSKPLFRVPGIKIISIG